MTAQHRADHVRNTHTGFLMVIIGAELLAIGVLSLLLAVRG